MVPAPWHDAVARAFAAGLLPARPSLAAASALSALAAASSSYLRLGVTGQLLLLLLLLLLILLC
jgi:hypothetical protein